MQRCLSRPCQRPCKSRRLPEGFVGEVGLGAVGAAVVKAVLRHIGFFDFYGAVVEGGGDGGSRRDDDGHFGGEDQPVAAFDPFGGDFKDFCHNVVGLRVKHFS